MKESNNDGCQFSALSTKIDALREIFEVKLVSMETNICSKVSAVSESVDSLSDKVHDNDNRINNHINSHNSVLRAFTNKSLEVVFYVFLFVCIAVTVLSVKEGLALKLIGAIVG